MKRVGRIAAPFVAVGLALTSGCEAAPAVSTAPTLAPIAQQTGEDLYAALKIRADILAALAIRTIRNSPEKHDSGTYSTEQGPSLCVDNLPAMPIEKDPDLRARACYEPDAGTVEINLSKTPANGGRYNVSVVFQANRAGDTTTTAANSDNMPAVESAIGDANALIGAAGVENGTVTDTGDFSSDLTWVMMTDGNGKIMGTSSANTVNADPILNGSEITASEAVIIGASIDRITAMMTR